MLFVHVLNRTFELPTVFVAICLAISEDRRRRNILPTPTSPSGLPRNKGLAGGTIFPGVSAAFRSRRVSGRMISPTFAASATGQTYRTVNDSSRTAPSRTRRLYFIRENDRFRPTRAEPTDENNNVRGTTRNAYAYHCGRSQTECLVFLGVIRFTTHGRTHAHDVRVNRDGFRFRKTHGLSDNRKRSPFRFRATFVRTRTIARTLLENFAVFAIRFTVLDGPQNMSVFACKPRHYGRCTSYETGPRDITIVFDKKHRKKIHTTKYAWTFS